MDNKYLFGAIGVLLVFIAGIGLFAAVQHPQETAAIPQSAVGAVGEAVQTATSAVSGSDSATGTSSTAPAESQTSSSGQSASTQTSTATAGTYTMAQVQAHNSASSCYTTINGSVYDLTQWISQHPGGSRAILSLCGIDGTQKFENQHGGQARPEQELASLKIGTLAK
jgi:cytochrome b involved in lipid metabolism